MNIELISYRWIAGLLVLLICLPSLGMDKSGSCTKSLAYRCIKKTSMNGTLSLSGFLGDYEFWCGMEIKSSTSLPYRRCLYIRLECLTDRMMEWCRVNLNIKGCLWKWELTY